MINKLLDLLMLPLILIIKIWQKFIAPGLAPRCKYYPSCSQYTTEAIQSHGILHGNYLALRRILRCHPWCQGGIDLVPEK